jgi:hypothetical protein
MISAAPAAMAGTAAKQNPIFRCEMLLVENRFSGFLISLPSPNESFLQTYIIMAGLLSKDIAFRLESRP